MATQSKEFNRICEAFEVLSNAQFKAIYDAFGETVLKDGFSPEETKMYNGGKQLPLQYRWKGNAQAIYD